MMVNLTEREMDKLIETLTLYSEDEGPNAGGGWKSDELKQLINKIEKQRNGGISMGDSKQGLDEETIKKGEELFKKFPTLKQFQEAQHSVDSASVNENEKSSPHICPKSYSPYVYCPLMFMSADDMIGHYLTKFTLDIKRMNGLEMQIGDEGILVNSYCGEITAYMNGRLHEALNYAKERGK